MAVARMPPISLASASWVNRFRAPNSSGRVTLSSENRPSTQMFRPTAMPIVIKVGFALVIMISIGKAQSMAMIANAM